MSVVSVGAGGSASSRGPRKDHRLTLAVKVKVAHLCPTLCYPMDYTVHGILQARILKWVAFPFSRVTAPTKEAYQ